MSIKMMQKQIYPKTAAISHRIPCIRGQALCNGNEQQQQKSNITNMRESVSHIDEAIIAARGNRDVTYGRNITTGALY